MTYGLGVTVAVTERGQIFTSDDLELWEPRESGTTNSLRSVTFFGERLIVTGERGTVLWADSLQEFHPVSLGTPDWLEGVVASPELLVAVGDNGAIYTSRTGTNWSRHTTSITDWLAGVAWGQGTFVTVGDRGLIATSVNGTNWTKRTSGTTRNLKRVSWMKNQFWAVGEGGLILSSPVGGSNWSPINSGATNTLFDAEMATDDLVIAGENELRLRRSNSVWTDELASSGTSLPSQWTYYNAVWDGSLFLLSGRTGRLVEGYQPASAEPYVWVERNRSIRNWLFEVHRTPELYVTAGFQGTVMTSGDGINWELELVPDAVTNTTLFGIGGTTNRLIAVGEGGKIIISPNVFTNLVFTNLDQSVITNAASSLGVAWQSVPSPTTNTLQGVATLGNVHVLTGDYGTVLTSSDGTNWMQQSTPTTNFLSGVASYPGGLVSVGQRGTLLNSSDGVTWTDRPSGTTNWLYRVRYLGGQLIAVGQNGTILTSGDGVDWTPRMSGTTRWLNDVALLGETYHVVGVLGTVLASSNAVNWVSLGTITEKALYGVAGYGGQLVAVGVEGTIVRSRVSPDLTPVRILNFSMQTNFNSYLFGGRTDQRFTLDRSAEMTRWTPGLRLEFLDSSGTLLLIEAVGTNRPPTEFYRATLQP